VTRLRATTVDFEQLQNLILHNVTQQGDQIRDATLLIGHWSHVQQWTKHVPVMDQLGGSVGDLRGMNLCGSLMTCRGQRYDAAHVRRSYRRLWHLSPISISHEACSITT